MKFPVLIKSPLFRGLTESDIETLIGSVHYRVRLFPSGSLVVVCGEEINSVIIVLSGSVKGEMVDISGRTIKIEDISPPHALAAAFVYGAGAKYPVNIITNNDSELLIFSRADFLALMKHDERILANYLGVVCSKARFLSDRLRFLSFRTIKGKFAHYLSGLPGASSGRVIVDRTQMDLSDYFGVTRPSLARAIGEMVDEGLISTDRREVRLLNVEGLARLTGG
jgi:CRP-like cAMP-binding protein